MRKEGRNSQPPIISLCSWWRTVSSQSVWQSCRVLYRGRYGSAVAVQNRAGKQSQQVQNIAYFHCIYLLTLIFWSPFLIFYIKRYSLKRQNMLTTYHSAIRMPVMMCKHAMGLFGGTKARRVQVKINRFFVLCAHYSDSSVRLTTTTSIVGWIWK